MVKIIKKYYVITGYYEFEERESKKQMHGVLVVKGGKDLKITEFNDEE